MQPDTGQHRVMFNKQETAMKRSGPIKRKTPLKPGKGISNKRKAKPGVPKDVYAEVVARDGGCVARTAWPDIPCYGRLDPHHVLRRSQGGKDEASNLITLCRVHHSTVHENPARSYELGFLKKPTNSNQESN
jgi:hypothetical protein